MTVYRQRFFCVTGVVSDGYKVKESLLALSDRGFHEE